MVFTSPAIKAVYTDGSCLNCQFGRAANPSFEAGGTAISFIQSGQVAVDGIDGNRLASAAFGAASDAVWSVGGALAVVRNGAIWGGHPGALRRIAGGAEPSWSPAGTLIAAVQHGWVVIMRVRDHRVRRLVRGRSPAFSPDGRLIAYVGGHHRLMVARASGTPMPRQVGGVRARSVDWQPRPHRSVPACVAPRGSTILASSREAVVTANGFVPVSSLDFSNAPPIAYMGCLRADGRERLLERFAENNVDYSEWVGAGVLSAPYAALVLTSESQHYYVGRGSVVQVFDLRRGLLTKFGGERGVCDAGVTGPGTCGDSPFDRVLLGSNGVSATHSQTELPVGRLSTGMKQVSCSPSSTVCVAIAEDSQLLSSNDPDGGATAWTTVAGMRLGAVACPKISLCVGAYDGHILSSANPAGGAPAWTSTASVWADELSCPSSTLCVASRYDGTVSTSTNPTGGNDAWSTAHVAVAGSLLNVFCSTLPVCFMTDSSQSSYVSTNPTAGASEWTRTTHTPSFTSGVCPAASLCVAINGTRILTTTDPAAETWTQTSVADPLHSIACASASLCVAVGSNGAVEVSTDPAAGVWTHTTTDQGRTLTAVACPSGALCVAGDQTGHVVTSPNPTVNAAWTPALIDGDPCTDTTPCSVEQIQASDRTGTRIVDTSQLAGAGPFLTDLTLTDDQLSWSHDGTVRNITLTH